MKIDDANSSGLKGLANRQRNLVAAKEREIENVRNFYDAKKDADRLSGQKELMDVKDANQQEILSALKNKSTRLEDMRDKLQGDLTRLQDERAVISQQKALTKESARAQMNDEQERLGQEAIEKSREIGEHANQQVAKLQDETQWQIARAAVDSNQKIEAQTSAHETSLADQMRQQQVQMTTREIEHNQQLNKLKSDFSKENAQVTRSNIVQKNNLEQQHIKEANAQEDKYKNLLKAKRTQFEQKFAHLEKEHNEIMQRTEAKFREQLSALSADYSKKRQAAQTRGADPFYNLQKIEHRIEETPKAYLIKIDVPEHEADKVVLTGHDRTIKMTLSRRFSERVDGEKGQIDINRRSENFTQEFPVANIINSKNISRNYADGVLTFRVEKA